MAMGGGIRRNSGTELILYLGCTGSTLSVTAIHQTIDNMNEEFAHIRVSI